jgi:hypothetical protein
MPAPSENKTKDANQSKTTRIEPPFKTLFTGDAPNAARPTTKSQRLLLNKSPAAESKAFAAIFLAPQKFLRSPFPL